MGDSCYATLEIIDLPYDTASLHAVRDEVLQWFAYGDALALDLANPELSPAELRDVLLTADFADGETDLSFRWEAPDALADAGATFMAYADGYEEVGTEAVYFVPGVRFGFAHAGEGYETFERVLKATFPLEIYEDQTVELIDAMRKHFGRDTYDRYQEILRSTCTHEQRTMGKCARCGIEMP